MRRDQTGTQRARPGGLGRIVAEIDQCWWLQMIDEFEMLQEEFDAAGANWGSQVIGTQVTVAELGLSCARAAG